MTEKIYNVDELYFAKLGVKRNLFDGDNITYKVESIKYVCVRVAQCGLEKPILLDNILNDMQYKMFKTTLPDGTICVSALGFVPARKFFSDKRFKVLNKDIAKQVAEELDKKPEERDVTKFWLDACKLNKIKTHNKNKTTNANLEEIL